MNGETRSHSGPGFAQRGSPTDANPRVTPARVGFLSCRSEAWAAAAEFGRLFGLDDVLRECTDPYDVRGIDWHTAHMDLGVPGREWAGRSL
jgi:hypothetical protein